MDDIVAFNSTAAAAAAAAAASAAAASTYINTAASIGWQAIVVRVCVYIGDLNT